MRMKHCFTGLCFTLMVALSGIAAGESTSAPGTNEHIEEVVVTATRIETPTSEVGSSVTVITASQIEEQKKSKVTEVMRSVPGLDVVQQGPGGTTSIFMRGAKSEHTLILIDGIEMNDPTTPGRSYDFSSLTTDNIERIEVIRGPQSTLYGSDAIGGVINIITKKGKGAPGGFIAAEAGSYKTFRGNAGINGGTGMFNYSLGLSRQETDGFSSAAHDDGNDEDDGHNNTSISARLGITPSDIFDIDCVLRWIDTETDWDNHGGVGGDDPNYTAETEQLFFRSQARLSLLDDIWEQKLGISVSDNERNSENDTDVDHPVDLSQESYEGKIVKLDWQNNLYLHETNTVTIGVETEKEEAKSDYYSESFYGPYSSNFEKESARTTGCYLQDQIKLKDALFTTLCVRLDDHSDFGSEVTYRIATAYVIKQAGTKFKGSYGTGFKAPSLYQLYSAYGDENLDPEESTGWDIGVEQTLPGGRLVVGVTYFSNDFDDLIDYDYATSTYNNIAEAEASGFELVATVQPTEELTIRTSYTYTDTEDKTTGEDLLRRAHNKFGLNANYRFVEKANLNVGITYVGERDDVETDYSTYTSSRVELDAYTLVNVAASYDITRNIQIYTRIENLFDEEYEEVRGYGTAGFSAFGGLKATF